MTDTDIRVIREVYDENLTPDGPTPATHPVTGEPCSLGELKRALGASRRPPIAPGSIHLLVTGQTHPDAGGPIHPVARAAGRTDDGEAVTYAVVREVYRIGKTKGKRRGRRDRSVLVSRTRAGDDGTGHYVTHTRLVSLDADGAVVDPGTPLTIEGVAHEGNRELSKGKVLDAMCDPKLVLDGRPNGLPLDADDGHRS